MLDANYLLDNFHAEGTDLEECKSFIAEFLDHTKFEKRNSAEMHILSHFAESDERFHFYELNPDKLPTSEPLLTLMHFKIGITKASMAAKDVTENLMDEIRSTKVMLNDGTIRYFTSNNAFATLDQFGLKGNFLSEPCVERDLMIAKQFAKERKSTFVIRNYNNVNKIFAIMSDNYTPVSQNFIFTIIDKIKADGIMGDVVCRKWYVNHFLTCVDIEFPKKAEDLRTLYGLPNNFIPGIRITTSDTGDCSLRITGTWRINNSLSLTQEVSRKHKGNIDLSKIQDEIDKKIFSEYVKLPETLCDLMAHDVTPVELDLSNERDKQSNFSTIEDTIKSVFSQMGMVKAVGKKNEIQLRKLLLAEIDTSVRYTAYDIAMQIMTLPERIDGMNEDTLNRLGKAIAEVPYCNYDPTVGFILT